MQGSGGPGGQQGGKPGGMGQAGVEGGGPIQKFDKNGDGKISLDEAPPRMKENFSQHDTNGDGFIDADEAKSLPAPGRQGGQEGGPGGQPPQ